MLKIALVGLGSLGQRYLEGLSELAVGPVTIQAIDNSESRLEECELKWAKLFAIRTTSKVFFAQNFDLLTPQINLVILATTSSSRASIVRELSSSCSPEFWLLEKILTQSSDDLCGIKAATVGAKAAWVNTPRRIMAWHKELKSVFSNKGPIRVSKDGGLWGLACNAIHFIDLLSWWSGETLVAIDTSGLDPEWIPSKRVGYFEVTGTLVAHYSGGSELIMRSKVSASNDFLKVNIANGNCWLIDESKGSAQSSSSIHINGRLEYQSELTAPMVTDILTNGTCGLPTLKESSAQHAVFLDAMLNHWNRSLNSNDRKVPIT